MTGWSTWRTALRGTAGAIWAGALALVLVSVALALIPDTGAGVAGTDATWYARALEYLARTIRLDFGGNSGLILDGLLHTVVIVAWSLVLILGVGLPVGVARAVQPDRRIVRLADRAVSLLSNVPVLVWALALFLVFSAMDLPIRTPRDWSDKLWFAPLVVLPLAFGDGMVADLVNRVSLEARSLLEEAHMRTVRANGLGFGRHLLRGLTPAIAELIASRSLFLVSAAIVVEWIFVWPGVGFHVLEGLRDKAMGTILGMTVGLVLVGLAMRLLASSISALADPRRIRG